MRDEFPRIFLRFGELWGRGIGRKWFFRLYFRRIFFLRRAGDSPPYRSRLRCNCGGFFDRLGKGQFDAGEVERRKDIRMRGVFKVGDQRRGDKTVDRNRQQNRINDFHH